MGQTSPSQCIEIKDGTHVAKCVLMPGDPLRAKYVAETYLENPVLFNDVRGMLGYTGLFEGKEVSVMGSGMGIPSITLYATELFSFFGVEAIIRIGSAGGLGDNVKVRDLLIAMTATSTSAYSDCLAMFQISDHIFTGDHLNPQQIREGFHEMMEIALKTAIRV